MCIAKTESLNDCKNITCIMLESHPLKLDLRLIKRDMYIFKYHRGQHLYIHHVVLTGMALER
jgi:hypothetical protein